MPKTLISASTWMLNTASLITSVTPVSSTVSVPEECGYWDTDDFEAYELCCACIEKEEEENGEDLCYDDWEGCCDSTDGN